MYTQGLQVDRCKIIHFLHFNLDYILYLKKSNLGKLEYKFSPFLFLKTLHHLELHYPNQMGKNIGFTFVTLDTLLEILSFATSHYVIGMQLVVVCNYLGHVCNYKFGII
jgi:hypothetical protein